jgi:hypothetical protein
MLEDREVPLLHEELAEAIDDLVCHGDLLLC